MATIPDDTFAELLTLDLTIAFIGKERMAADYVPGAATPAARTNTFAGYNVQRYFSPDVQTPTLLPVQLALAKWTFATGVPQTIDLAAAPAPGRTIDLTGKKVFAYLLKSDDNNTSQITLDTSIANGYPLFGDGNEYDLLPSEVVGSSLLTNQRVAVEADKRLIQITALDNQILYWKIYVGDDPS